MKVVVAIDSFKGSLSSIEAGNAIKDGIKEVYKDSLVLISPLADGGEGTVEALVSAMDGEYHSVLVKGPLCNETKALYGIINNNVAVMEMSQASGITLVKREQLNPLDATTYGVGEMIKDAISKGVRKFIIGIGGSATNDVGVGMLSALGYKFLDKDGNEVLLGAKGIKDIKEIDDTNVLAELKDCVFNIACDVTNPLCGENGASYVYSPQKGATKEDVINMDRWISDYADVVKQKYPHSDKNYPGSGAAGGLGFAFKTFLNANLKSGINIVLEETKLEDKIKDADLVITGEGRLDFQSSMGKAPVGVAHLAKKYGVGVIAFAGSVTKDAKECNNCGIDAFFPILRGICTLDEAMNKENAYQNLKDTTEQVMRVYKIK